MMVQWDVIIVGGSYAGLSAAMSLGRSLRKVLVVDAGNPCNAVTPHSHNFLTNDGQEPAGIAAKARDEVKRYDSVNIIHAQVSSANITENAFEVITDSHQRYTAKKIIIATGLKDHMPGIPGFAACWGKTVLHCPYCHGYEIKNEPVGIIADADVITHLVPLIYNLTQKLTLFTTQANHLDAALLKKLRQHNIPIIDTPIRALQHQNGQVTAVELTDGRVFPLTALFSRPAFEQGSDIYQQLGCKLNEQGLLQVDMFQQTNVAGVFACGDNSNRARSVALAVSSGSMAGAAVNNQLATEQF